MVATTAALAFMVRNRCFALSFAMTAIFYFPSLIHGSVDAGFLYSGDALGQYLPMLAKTYDLLSSFNFTAIDYSSFNGSSDFFLSPSSHSYHPLVVIYSLLVPAKIATFQELGRLLVWLLAFHSFLACYFSIKLFTRFFSFEYGPAGLVGSAFAFSIYMVFSHNQPSFLFSVALIPWVAYAALCYSERPTFRQLVLASLPVVFLLLGSYLPLGVASLALSVVLVMASIVMIDDSGAPHAERFRRFFVALLPYVFASIVVLPYLYSVYSFYQETSAAVAPSLFFSAHQLAEQPQSLLRLISTHFSVPGPSAEFSVSWGLISIVIASLFIFGARSADALTPKNWTIFKLAALIYFATVLSIFGEYSVVSDLVYHLVPQVGTMHIYQRFLLPAHLLFAVMVALMLKAVVEVRPPIATRIVVAIFGVATLGAAYLVGRNPALSLEIGLNNYLVFELLLAFLFACALMFPGKAFIYSAAIILFCLPALAHMYNSSHSGTFEAQRKRQIVALDEAEKARIVSYLKRVAGDKAVIKYVDITPLWNKEGIETFPKSFPFLVLKELRLSSYSGYMFYFGGRADYMRKMPIGAEVAVNPDWELVLKTGADFVVTRQSDIQNNALINKLFARVKAEDMLRLHNDVVIIPLRGEVERALSAEAVKFDNGVFRISATIDDAVRNLQNIAVGKPVRQSSTFGVAEARLAVDGKTDGHFDLGSVSTTDRDVNAWLDIDLGATEEIDSVRVWNRMDGTESRLRDFWIFISDAPFLATDTASMLQERSATWGKQAYSVPMPAVTMKTGGIRGRYVRVQLGGKQPADQSYLSLAEVEVFRSDKPQISASTPQSGGPFDVRVKKFDNNHANHMQLQFEASAPSTVAYLFWDNPRLKYYLNGQRVKVVERDGLWTINAPAGLNTIEIRYVHWPLRVFWILYAMYALVLLWVSMPTRFQARIKGKVFALKARAANRNNRLGTVPAEGK